jgi:predicted HicB family RNase H-like nuclease
MKLPLILAGVAGLIGVAALTPAADLTFHPAESTKLTKTYSISADFALDDLSITMNGEEMDPAMMGIDLDEASGEFSGTMSFTDEYVSMEGAKATELKRTFTSMTAEFESGSGESGSESNDDIEGKTIVFKLDKETGEYALTDGEGEEVDEDLQFLGVDTDLTIFLPAGPVEEDATWTIEGKDMLKVFIPGIDIKKAMAKADEEAANNEAPFTPSELLDFMDEMGSIECTYKGTREVEGVTLQVISLVPTMEQTIDLTDMISDIIDEAAAGQEISINASVSLEGTGSGELLWDSKAGHFREYTLNLELSALLDGSGEAQGMAGGLEVETSTNLTFHFTAE